MPQVQDSVLGPTKTKRPTEAEIAAYRREKLKKEAYRQMKRALASGEIMKPDACEVCGDSDRVLHGHHEDYTKPLQLIWVCRVCHSQIHKDGDREQIGGPPKKTKMFVVRINEKEKERLKAIAKANGQTVSEWARIALLTSVIREEKRLNV